MEYTINPYTGELSPVLGQDASGDGMPDAANSLTIQRQTGEVILVGQMVALDATGRAVRADHRILAHADRVLGIAVTAANQGEMVVVLYQGEITSQIWNWDPTKGIFVGQEGGLLQSPPTQGFVCRVGFPVSSSQLMVGIGPAIELT